MKKNTAALVLSILGAIFAVIGGILWAACADTCAEVVQSSTGYTVGFLALGIGGAVISLIGGIQAFGFKRAGLALSVVGLLMQVGNLVLECVFLGGFSFVLSLWTILALIMLVIATVFAARKP